MCRGAAMARRNRVAAVRRFTLNPPVRVLPQLWVNPRKSKVAGFRFADHVHLRDRGAVLGEHW